MGGDGGVVATNRRYMRGAGTADHTGDVDKSSDKVSYDHDEAMKTCHISNKPLALPSSSTSSTTIVACPHGHLYNKETAIEALLNRKKNDSTAVETSGLGPQVRRLSDLYDVRVHLESNRLTCPITGKALTGSSVAAILLVPGKEGVPNVVSESALPKEKLTVLDATAAQGSESKPKKSRSQHFHLSQAELEQEYGPIHKRVRLAPPPSLLESTIIEQVRLEQEQEEAERKASKKSHKKDKKKKGTKKETPEDQNESKKRKRDNNGHDAAGGEKRTTTSSSSSASLGQVVQSRVDTAIKTNQVLSSLFTSNDRKVSAKEKKDNLFAR